jgi:hypothetical protein
MAGGVARYFRVAPHQLLTTTYFEWAVNVAAFEVTSSAEAAANKRSSNGRGNMPRNPGH